MIKFKNVAGNSFLAVGTIQRKFALNGEKSLSGVIYDGDDVLNNIDKGWSLEFDGEPYVVSYFERNDNDNTLSFDAVHKFFWVMSKSVMYSQTSGSHTIQWYLDQIFANTGYTYALNFSPNAIAKDNWGMKTKLSLFNDIISSINGEFEINGTLISVFEKVGSDLSTIVRYGFNLSDMSIENDAAGFVTYGEGFGAYEDQQNQSGPRLHATYTSPLASVYGILQAEPVDDQRYTIENNLIQAIKEKVDNSFTVSIKLSLYDLTIAGYPYKMAHVGDWLMAIDEKLDFKQRIRIISIDDEFDANGNRIGYTVTAGNIGVVQKYQESNASLTSQVSNALDAANKASDDANIALISANGKNTSYYVDSVDALPTTANEGDMGWVQSGDGRVLYIYTKKPDGAYYWEKRIDPEISEQIAAGVDKAVTDAKTYSDQAIATNREQVDAEIKTVSDKTAQLESEQAELDTKAQGYADKALADAKADTQATAAQTAKDASDALAKAKTDLTTSLNKEVTDRANAVTALDTKAKGYADTAKADAIATANGAVAKEVTDRQKAITDLDVKSTGAINQAKTDAQSALDALQVGTRNLFLNSKTLWNVSSNGGDNAKEDFDTTTNMWHITSPAGSGINKGIYFSIANNTSTAIPVGQPWTISVDIKGTGLFKQIGLENSVTKGPTGNLPTDWTRVSATGIRTTANNVVMYFDATTVALDVYIKLPKLEQGTKATDYTQAPEDIVLDYTTKDNVISQSLTQYQATNDGKVTKAQSDATQALGLVATKVSQTDYNTKTGDLDSKYTAVKQTADQASTDIVAIKSTNTSQDTKINTLTSDVSGTKQSISDIQTEQGKQSTKINTIQTDVSGTKQDISDIQDANGVQDGKIASISTTVDGLSSSFSTYKTTNDGKVAKAQADITANATAISQKVSQTAYDTKTGQLQTDLNTTTTTANQAKTDIVAIKSDNTKQDARMTTIESDANGTKTTVSNLQTDLGKANGSITTLQQRADGFDATVTKVNNLAVGGRNLFLGTRTFDNSKGVWSNVVIEQGSTYQGFWTTWNASAWGGPKYRLDALRDQGVLNTTDTFVMSAWVKNTSDTAVPIGFYGTDNTTVWTNPNGYLVATLPAHSEWTRVASRPFKFQNIGNVGSTGIRFEPTISVTGGNVKQAGLKLEIGNMPTAWTPAPEDVDSATAKAQLTADQATTSLNNYKSDADGRISKAQADIIVNANAITQKVSQSDYNAKTGDLTTKVNTAQSTADSATSTIGAYKTSNDARVASAESKITANANAITQKVSQSDYNQKTGELSGKISEISQTAGQISQSVSDVKAQVDGLSVGGGTNLLIGTSRNEVSGKSYWIGNYKISGGLQPGTTYTLSGWARVDQTAMNNQQHVFACAYTSDWSWAGWLSIDSSLTAKYNKITFTTPSGKQFSPTVDFYLSHPNGDGSKDSISGTGYISKLKLEKGIVATDWSPAPEDVDNKISTVSQTVDSISSIVSDPTTGLTKRVQTAEGTLSQVTGADIPALQKATYWQAPNGYDLNTYLTQGSFFFRDTTARTNSPTTRTDWMYLVVERGSSSRVTQVAWYDQLNDAKISYKRQYTGTWSPWYANDNDSVTTISQTNSSIKQEISDRQTGDNNTLQSSKDFTSSQISNSESNMKSLINQKADSAIVGVIQNDVSSLKNNVNWQSMSYDDVNYLKDNGNYLITGGSGANSPFTPWFYIKVDAPRTDRITQTLWKDLYGTLMYRRTYDGSSWSPWAQIVMSSTLLSIFHDSWSLGTSTNDGITKQMITGIMGQPDGTLILKGNSLILDGNTTVTGDFYAKGGNFKNLNASNFTSGTIDANQINVINLNVNNLTGDISNWILSKWTSATGNNVTIDGNGLYFAPGTSRMTTNGFEAWRKDSGRYKAMGMVGSYSWQTNSDINGMGLIAKFYDQPHGDQGDQYRNEEWGADTIAIGALAPQSGHGYDYVDPFLVFPANNGIGDMYFPGNGVDTILMGRWLSIYTGLNMRGHAITNSSGYSLKENFYSVSGDDALEIFDNTDILTYDYKPDSDNMDEQTAAGMKNKVGFVINDNGESPYKIDERLVRYGNTRDDSVTVGYLMAAVKELHKKVKKLESLNV